MCEAEQDTLWKCSLNLLVLGCRRRNIVDCDVVTAVVNVFIVADDDVEDDLIIAFRTACELFRKFSINSAYI